MVAYIPWYQQEDDNPLNQEDGNLLLMDGEIAFNVPPDPPDPPDPPVDHGPPGILSWDAVGARMYETGLDHGVLYPQSGSAVPWNGLTSISEKPDQERQSVYFDGMKINDLVALGDFAATMSAVSYPDKFTEIEGCAEINPGMFLGNQKPQVFSLSYRTLIGTDVDPDAGYKLHLLYNVIAIPSDRTYETLTDSPSLVEFQWEITAVPEEIVGYRPTAHVIFDSRTFDPVLMTILQNMMYGTTTTPAHLLPLDDLVTYLNDFFRVRIVDNGDGTWSAFSNQAGTIIDNGDGTFQIQDVSGIFLDANTYQISSTS